MRHGLLLGASAAMVGRVYCCQKGPECSALTLNLLELI
jgi:hypothetical protein